MNTIRVRAPRQPRPASLRAGRPVTKALDILTGYVREVVDGRTIDLNLVAPTADQLERYRGSELVRLVGSTVETASADLADLRSRLYRKQVRCFVHGRDSDGRLLAVAVPVARAS
jgi:endonuclease YncB( thermonuclease family)